MSRLRIALQQKTKDLERYITESTAEINALKSQLASLTEANKLLETDNRALLSTFEQ